MKLTPEQKIKREMLLQAIAAGDLSDQEITSENVDDLYDEAKEDNYMWDYISEFRSSGTATPEIPSKSSRHYESDSVAHQCNDGSWVGWTYWHGGGKHGDPDGIDWMNEAYDLQCKEEEKLVIVRTFTKPA